MDAWVTRLRWQAPGRTCLLRHPGWTTTGIAPGCRRPAESAAASTRPVRAGAIQPGLVHADTTRPATVQPSTIRHRNICPRTVLTSWP